ncbi:hypothetical protein SMB34_00190 [Thalassospira permensis NBRC 106175]|uniref:Uncharacterized protein n=1 Tax=Thalassospira permensis NBRC 106175 TaxID=1353532 RepID=A0ABR4TUF9_9PROT|nr:hypothetical protein SMB34_00190 [Thalassospira permensis NBRC 106175]
MSNMKNRVERHFFCQKTRFFDYSLKMKNAGDCQK